MVGWNAYETDPESKVIRTPILIGGVKANVFGLENIPPPPEGETKKVAVLFVMHGRSNDHRLTDSIGHIIVNDRLKKEPNAKIPLISIVFDVPNHGERAVDLWKNESVPENFYESLNLCSFADGAINEIINIVDYLPAYYPQFEFVPFSMGTSLGGMISCQLATRIPLAGVINIVGTPDVASLMYHVARKTPLAERTSDVFRKPYSELGLSGDAAKKYPKAFHEKLSKVVNAFYDEALPKTPVLLIYGSEDPAVPPVFNADLKAKAGVAGYDVESYSEPVSHTTTWTMLDRVKQWLYPRIDTL